MWHVWVRSEVHTEFWRQNQKEGDHLEDLGVHEMIILKWILKIYDGLAWAGLMWLRTHKWPALLNVVMYFGVT
jgi:hypothetical protein